MGAVAQEEEIRRLKSEAALGDRKDSALIKNLKQEERDMNALRREHRAEIDSSETRRKVEDLQKRFQAEVAELTAKHKVQLGQTEALGRAEAEVLWQKKLDESEANWKVEVAEINAKHLVALARAERRNTADTEAIEEATMEVTKRVSTELEEETDVFREEHALKVGDLWNEIAE